MVVKRLLIEASSSYEAQFLTVPVNSTEVIVLQSDIGVCQLQIFIRDFEGSEPHRDNSKYNFADDAASNEDEDSKGRIQADTLPNLRILIKFNPARPMNGSDLVFGNESLTPIKDYVPVSLLSTGLKFFSWWLNPSVKGDLYNNMPFLFGLALNSFTKIYAEDHCMQKGDKLYPLDDDTENLGDVSSLDIPDHCTARSKYFSDTAKAAEFIFDQDHDYTFQFDTNYVKLANSQYKLLIPTYGTKSLDIDVGGYANDKLNSFNWVLKEFGLDGAKKGHIGLIIRFSLVDEE